MFGLIFAVLVVIAGIVCGVFMKHNDGSFAAPVLAAILIAVVIVGCSCINSVPTGHTGVVTTFGRVENYTLDAGIHFLAPWQNVIEMDNRVQKSTVELSCFSSDIQEVSVIYTLNYQINKTTASNLYKSVGKDYSDKVIAPNVVECVKVATAKYTAEELVNERSALATLIEEMLRECLQVQDIEVVNTAIEDMDFTDAFTNAVEAKQVAAQNKLKAETEQAQKTMEAQNEAARAVITAEAEAEKKKIAAEADAEIKRVAAKAEADAIREKADAEAEANNKIAASLSQALIDYNYIQSWNGQLPGTYVGSENVSTILNPDN